ncbi:hypothetical protein K439DRAFT_1383972 [Ramaria rubella]|nr:hypothetical protein K439DRAFT_1383972 [Ramaria rubella]
MCHLSPTVHLAWATLSCALQIFLIQHLWRYDRFKCLAWSSGRQPGTFKRIMTYSYLGSVPALVVYSCSMAVLKYRNGYHFIPGHGIIPTPFQLWSESDRSWLSPLYILFGVTWGLELVTHLEELTFWLFLLHQGPTRREWFTSTEFKAWAVASSVAIAGMPITAIVTRSNPLTAEAYIFLVGGAASTCVTAVFFIVLFRFPEFLRRVKREGATGPVVLRLVKFHELNILRVIFRLFMTIPLIILGIDGVRGHHIINNSSFWTDLLAFFAAVGTIVSSTLTLLIFFPRSLAEDSNWRPRTIDTTSHVSFASGSANEHVRPVFSLKPSYQMGLDSADGEDPFKNDPDMKLPSSGAPILSKSKDKYYSGHFTAPSALTTAYHPPAHDVNSDAQFNAGMDHELRDMEEGDADEEPSMSWRVPDSQTELRGDQKSDETSHPHYEDGPYGATRAVRDSTHLKVRMMELGAAVDAGMKKPPRPPRLHPYITSFTSPIDLLQYSDDVPRAI